MPSPRPGRRRALLRSVVLLVLLAGLLSVGNRERASASPAGPQLAAASDPVIAAAGDIACDPTNSNFNGGLGTSKNCRQKYTSDLLVNSGLDAVLILGDNQYYCGGYQAYVQSYDLSWGRIKGITRPAAGNHEYLTSGGTDCNSANAGATGYYRYFGAAAGDPSKGYYSYDIGTWHLIVLNSNCSKAGGCGVTTPQGKWLRADLAAHTNFCTLAYWHTPVFSSGGRADSAYKTFWDALYAADADLILAAHDHLYERFGPQRPDGTADAVRGLRSFVVGTGGANFTSFTNTIFANSEVRNDKTFGVLKLTLHPTSYDWQFVPEAGATFTDMGTTACHGTQSDTTPPTAPSNLQAGAVAPNGIDLNWGPSSDDVGVLGYRISRDGAQVATVTGTSYADRGVQPNTTHSYSVAAYDGGGNVSPPSNTASATTPRDTQPPTAPGNLGASAPNGYRVNLSWNASSDDVAIAYYQVFRDGVPLASATTTSYSDMTAEAQATYSYTVVAWDTANNPSPSSNAVIVTTPAAPTILIFGPDADAYVQSDQPTANFGPSNQIVVDASPVRRVLLKFVVSGIRGRQVVSAKLRLRCGDASSRGGSFHRVADSSWSEGTVNWNNQPAADAAVIASLGAVSVGTTYEVDLTSLVTGDGTYTVEADSTSSDGAYYDSKEGSAAPQLVVTTGSGTPDTTPPTAPTSLVAAPTGSQVDLSWTASTDDVGVVDYQVLRNGVPVGTSTATSYVDRTVQPSQTYSYTAVARDGAGNVSGPSNTATVTTPTSSTLTFGPSADTYVQSDQAAVNFGASTQFVADASPARRVLLKFVVSGVNGHPVVSAKLRLRCVDPSGTGGNVHRVVDSSWSEGIVNWNNQPAADAAVIASLGAVSAGTTYEIDLTSLVTADGTYTVEVDSTSSDGAYYSSKEGSVAPQLVLTLS
jgi:chitodextrinase